MNGLPASARETVPRPLHVLIVEDSEDDSLLLVRELERRGYKPIWKRVDSAEAMSAALDQATWDAVLSDYSMPGFSASKALSLLRQVETDVPFLLVSSTIGEEQAVAMMKAGASDYVLKDRLSRLVPAVERELEEAETRRRRRQAEETVRQSEERLRLMFEASADGFWDWNIATGEALYSPRWAELLGHRVEDLEQHVRTWERHVHPEDLPRVREELQRHLMGVSPQFVSEHRVVTKSGDEKHLLDRGRVVERDADGKALRMVGTYIDISERKSLETRLLAAKKIEAVGRLAGGIAHDFNNLLTAITGFSRLVLDKLGSEDPLRADIELVRDAGEKAANLTRQLLAFSRRQVLQPRVLDLNSVIAGFETLLGRTIGEDIQIRTVLDPALGHVKADPGQIEQVLLNLAVNARDAMPDGGTLTIETACWDVEGAYAALQPFPSPGRYVTLAVTDTGVGMDEETQRRAFEPFFTTKEKGRGTGFGLATSYGIVKQSGGHMWIYSELGQGTTFKICLPRVEEPVREATREDPIDKSEGGSETILIVEDDQMVRDFAARVLENNGYRVLVAQDAQQAIRISTHCEGCLDLLVTDLVMPGGTGLELAQQIAKIAPAAKTLYISGYADKGVVRNGQLEEDMEFLGKPFSDTALTSRVRQILDRKEP